LSREPGEDFVTDAAPTIETQIPGETNRPLRADARRNRERILASARQVFAEDGPGAQIDDVARHAGVGVGTVYRHFPTKEALLAELVRQKFRLFADRAREALDSDAEPFAVIEELLRRNAATAAEDVGVQYALAGAGEEAWTQAEAEQQELLDVMGELIERARRAGTIRPDIEPMDIAMLMCGVCTTMSPREGFDWHRHLQLVIDVLRPRN
jgi:AcrR family transcriptional regulator